MGSTRVKAPRVVGIGSERVRILWREMLLITMRPSRYCNYVRDVSIQSRGNSTIMLSAVTICL